MAYLTTFREGFFPPMRGTGGGVGQMIWNPLLQTWSKDLGWRTALQLLACTQA